MKNIKVKWATFEDLDRLYKEEAAAFESVSFVGIDQDPIMCRKVLNKFHSVGLYLKDDTIIYMVDGTTMDVHYDLAGDNAYNANFVMALIPFDNLILPLNAKEATSHEELTEIGNVIQAIKTELGIRWFKDVVDNNEYREYANGRHEASEQIQWLIDAKKRMGSKPSSDTDKSISISGLI